MTRDTRRSMFDEAFALLERADRLHRQFFEPPRGSARGACWEPPVDILERNGEVWVIAALPGVEPDDIEVRVDGSLLIVAGMRPFPAAARTARIHRLEIPYGRFERRIGLTSQGYELTAHELRHGCLVLKLNRRF